MSKQVASVIVIGPRFSQNYAPIWSMALDLFGSWTNILIDQTHTYRQTIFKFSHVFLRIKPQYCVPQYKIHIKRVDHSKYIKFHTVNTIHSKYIKFHCKCYEKFSDVLNAISGFYDTLNRLQYEVNELFVSMFPSTRMVYNLLTMCCYFLTQVLFYNSTAFLSTKCYLSCIVCLFRENWFFAHRKLLIN